MRHPIMVAQDAFGTIVKYVYITKKKTGSDTRQYRVRALRGFGLQDDEFSAIVLRVRNMIQKGNLADHIHSTSGLFTSPTSFCDHSWTDCAVAADAVVTVGG